MSNDIFIKSKKASRRLVQDPEEIAQLNLGVKYEAVKHHVLRHKESAGECYRKKDGKCQKN